MSNDALQSFLDSGTAFEGKVAFSGVVRIDGHFKGEALADGTLVSGETGTVEADLELATLVVHGTFRGNVNAREVVELTPTGDRGSGQDREPAGGRRGRTERPDRDEKRPSAAQHPLAFRRRVAILRPPRAGCPLRA